jgi:hypothetical protein
MALSSWVLPTLIGIVSAVLLLTILFNDPYIKSKFSDLGALIQLETSRPVYYGMGWVPNNNFASNQLPPPVAQGNITTFNSPLYTGNPVSFPIYNYFPQTPLNPVPTNKQVSITNTNTNTNKVATTNNLAYTNPNTAFDAHKAYYWALSGGYPYPYPMYVLPATDMDKVRGVEDKI